jgi:hypothetical protein
MDLDLGIKIAQLLLSAAWVMILPYVKSINAKLTSMEQRQQVLGERVAGLEALVGTLTGKYLKGTS